MERQLEHLLLDKQLVKDIESTMRRIDLTKHLNDEEKKKEVIARSLRAVQTLQEFSVEVVAKHVEEESRQMIRFCQEDSVDLKSRLQNLSMTLVLLAALMELEIGRGSGIVVRKLATMLFGFVDKIQENTSVRDEIINTVQGIRLILMLQHTYPSGRRLSNKSASKTEPLERYKDDIATGAI